MKITYEIYKGTPYLVKADMSDPTVLTFKVTRGDALSVKFAGEEKKISRGYATFSTKTLKDDLHRATVFTKTGSHELIPIRLAFGTARLYHGEELIASLYSKMLEVRERVDGLCEITEKLNDAVFGSTIL